MGTYAAVVMYCDFLANIIVTLVKVPVCLLSIAETNLAVSTDTKRLVVRSTATAKGSAFEIADFLILLIDNSFDLFWGEICEVVVGAIRQRDDLRFWILLVFL